MSASLAAIRRDITARWASIVRAADLPRARRDAALRALPAVPRLLGSSSKVELGARHGALVAVVYMSPAREATGARRTLCPDATAQCAAACLGHAAGRMIMSPVKQARLWKTALYLGDRALWRELALAEIAAHTRRAWRMNLAPAVRIDGSTDTGEGRILAGAPGMTGVRFYDYTKSLSRVRADRAYPAPNYTLAYSVSGQERNTAAAVDEVIAAGGLVARVFDTPKGEALPVEWMGAPVVDGDAHDCIWMHPMGSVIGLRFKQATGRARALRSAGAFVERVT